MINNGTGKRQFCNEMFLREVCRAFCVFSCKGTSSEEKGLGKVVHALVSHSAGMYSDCNAVYCQPVLPVGA